LAKPSKPAVVVAHRGHHDVRAECGAVLAHAPALVLEAPLGARHFQLALRLAERALLFRVEARQPLADDLVGLVAEDALGARIPAGDAAFGVEHEDGVVDDAVHHQAEAPFAFHEHALGAMAHRQHRALQLPQHRAQDQAGEYHRADKKQEQQERFIERVRGERPDLALQGVPDGHRAHHRDRAGHLALSEAESHPHDQRHHHEGASQVAGERHLARGEEQPRQRHRLDDLARRPRHAADRPAQHQGGDEQHAAGVALPPGPPVPEHLARRKWMHRHQRQQGEGRRDRRAQGDHRDELDHLVGALEEVGNADQAAHQRRSGDRLHAAAGGDQQRDRNRSLDAEVGGERAQPDAGPCPGAMISKAASAMPEAGQMAAA
jgi:hypothetical protein